jgi:hypothetical protein
MSAQTYYKILMNRWTYVPGLRVGESTTEDFISDRSTTEIGVSHTLTYQALTYDDFFQYFSGHLQVESNQANLGNSYLVTHLDGELGVRFTEKFTSSIKGTFGKLYKSDFTRGVIYGGGISDFANKRVHEFYGLPYSDAFGNKIITSRVMGDYDLWDAYRGKNLLPLFLRELHLLFGFETMEADRIILGGQFLREKTITGLFAGPRFKMNLFYLVPANIDLIFSHISNPSGASVNQVDFLLSANLF